MHHVLAILLCATAPAGAQTITTAPAGYASLIGADSVPYPFSAAAGTFRYQEIHTSLRGTPLVNLVAAWFRRDEAGSAFASAGARTGNLEFVLGQGDIRYFTADFRANFSGGASVVMARRPVNLASWVGPGRWYQPEPWTNRLPFDAPFTHGGGLDLVWEVSYEAMTPTGLYPADRVPGSGALWTATLGENLGTGCTVQGRPSPFTLTTTLFHHVGSLILRLQYHVDNGPASQPVVLAIDGRNANLSLPYLCGTVVALPVLTVPIGTTTAGGATSPLAFATVPFQPSLLANRVYVQAMAPDPGAAPGLLPVAVSQGEACQWPALLVTTPAPASYAYSTDLRARFGSGPFVAGNVICGLER